MSRGMWRGVVRRAGCYSSGPRTILCPWPTTRRRSTGRWRRSRRCWERSDDGTRESLACGRVKSSPSPPPRRAPRCGLPSCFLAGPTSSRNRTWSSERARRALAKPGRAAGRCNWRYNSSVTLQRKLLLGFSLMVIPALLVGVQAIRTNALVRGTLQSLGERLARSRTYAEVEDAMFNQTQVIWRYLSGDPAAKQEFPLTEQVVAFWLDRWTAGLPPDALKFADGVRSIEGDIRAVAARVFTLYDSWHAEAAYVTARHELVERLQPALAAVNREIYRQARELSVQRAVAEMQAIVEAQRRVLWSIIFLALVVGLIASWLISL